MHRVDFAMMIAVTDILWLMMRSRRRIGRMEGMLPFVLYAVYLAWLIRLRR